MNQEQYDDFIKSAFKRVDGKKTIVWVHCEECENITTITNGKADCGHVPQWLKDVRAWLNSRDSSQ